MTKLCIIHLVFCLLFRACHASNYVVDDSPGLGRTFDGVGAISGGGVSSFMTGADRLNCDAKNQF